MVLWHHCKNTFHFKSVGLGINGILSIPNLIDSNKINIQYKKMKSDIYSVSLYKALC